MTLYCFTVPPPPHTPNLVRKKVTLSSVFFFTDKGGSANTFVSHWLIHLVDNPLVQNFQDTVYPKPWELGI